MLGSLGPGADAVTEGAVAGKPCIGLTERKQPVALGQILPLAVDEGNAFVMQTGIGINYQLRGLRARRFPRLEQHVEHPVVLDPIVYNLVGGEDDHHALSYYGPPPLWLALRPDCLVRDEQHQNRWFCLVASVSRPEF